MSRSALTRPFALTDSINKIFGGGISRHRHASRPVCPVDHEGVKLDDARWSALTYLGIQPSIDDNGQPEELELRNCVRCGSTLARLVTGGGK